MPTSRNRGSVLIADNDAGVSAVLREALLRAGFADVEVVGDGLAALDRLARGGVGVLVCDIDMPKLDGEALLGRLHRWVAPPPVVVVSAFLDELVRQDLARSKALFATLQKPFSLVAFTDTVAAAFDVRQHGPSQESPPASGSRGPNDGGQVRNGLFGDVRSVADPISDRQSGEGCPKNSAERA